MSFLAGLDNVFSRAGQISQRQQANNLAERRMLLDEQARAFELLTKNADDEYNMASRNKYLDETRTGLGQKFVDDLKAGNQDAKKQLIRLWNANDLTEGGGELTDITIGDDGIRGVVTNPDGSIGAITIGGSSDDNAVTEVASFDDGLLKNINSLWNGYVNKHTSKVDVAEMGARENLIEVYGASDDRVTAFQNNQIVLQNEIKLLDALANAPPTQKREAIAVMNNAKTPEEKAEVQAELGKDLGVSVSPLSSRKFRRDNPEAVKRQRDQKEIARLEAKIDQDSYRGRPGAIANQKKRDKEKLAELKAQQQPEGKTAEAAKPKPKQEDAAPKIKSESQPVQMELDAAVEKFEGKSVREIGQMAIAGEITLSPNALKEISNQLQQMGVKELQDLNKLNKKDRMIALSALASTVRPEDRAKFDQRVLNLFETGIESISAKDARGFTLDQDKLDVSRDTLRQRIKEFDDKVESQVITTAKGLLNDIDKIRTNENLKPNQKINRILSGPAINNYWVELDRYPPDEYPQEHEILMRSMNMVLSQVASDLASQEKGGVWESIASLVRPDIEEGEGSADMFLERIIMGKDGNTINYIEPAYADSDGNYKITEMDESFSLSALAGKNKRAAQLLRTAAMRNSKRYGLS